MVLEDLFCFFSFFTRPRIFLPIHIRFTRPNDGWTGLYIKLCCTVSFILIIFLTMSQTVTSMSYVIAHATLQITCSWLIEATLLVNVNSLTLVNKPKIPTYQLLHRLFILPIQPKQQNKLKFQLWNWYLDNNEARQTDAGSDRSLKDILRHLNETGWM